MYFYCTLCNGKKMTIVTTTKLGEGLSKAVNDLSPVHTFCKCFVRNEFDVTSLFCCKCFGRTLPYCSLRICDRTCIAFTYAGNMNQALRSVGFKILSSPLESTFFLGGWRYLIQQSLMIMIICLF